MAKVFGCSKVIWNLIFMLIQVLAFCLIIGAMATKYWFSQTWEIGGSSYVFKGQLIKPMSTAGQDCDNYLNCYDDCDGILCDQYQAWSGAAAGYILFETINLILILLNFTLLLFDLCGASCCKRLTSIFFTGIIMIIITVFNLVAFVIWAGITKPQSDDCAHSYPFTGTQSVCIQGGAVFAIFNIVLFAIITPVYFIVAMKLKLQILKDNGNYTEDLKIIILK